MYSSLTFFATLQFQILDSSDIFFNNAFNNLKLFKLISSFNVWSYFEKGCRKKFARDNPKR